MIWRAVVVAVAVALALVAVRLWERRPASAQRRLSSGLTLVTGADCRLCPQAVAAAVGADVPVRIVDVGDLADPGIRSLPTAFVADRSGTVIARRSGRSAVSGMADLIALARSVS